MNNGTYIKSVLSSGNANTLVVNDMYLNGDNNLVVRADSWFSPLKIDRTRMTQIGTGGSPHDYTIIFTPNLQTAVCASAVGWDNGTGINCTTTVPTSCIISAITTATQTTCDITTNKYNQEVIVTYTDAPSTGFLVVNGQNFPITSSPQTVTLTNLDANGNVVDVTASFSTVASCNFTENRLFTAPISCSDDVLNVNQTTVFSSIQAAVDAANPNDVLKILTNRRYDEDVVIDKTLFLTSDATSYNQIEIDQIKVNNGNRLTITGKMSVLELVHLEATSEMIIDGSTEFALRSTVTGTAMVINDADDNTIQGNVIMERYLPTPSTIPASGGIGFDGKAYHLFSSPFSNAAINQFAPYMDLILNINYNTAAEPAYTRPFPTFFIYDETNAGASTSAFYNEFISNYRVPTSTATDLLEVGKGYQANIATEQTLKFNGNLNNGIYTINLTNSGGSLPQQGYNLVGNPYPSPLDWEKIIADNTGNNNLANTIYLDIPTSQYNGTFAYYVAGTGVGINGGTKDIAAAQGFFVQATAPTGTLELKNEDRPTTYQDTRFFKTSQTQGLKEGLIKLGITKDNKTDETAIYFIEGATQNFDSKYDALKIYKQNSNFATLYSYNTENKVFAINGLDAFDETLQIPLAINVVEAGKHIIGVREIKYFHSLSELYLYDSLTETLHNLKEEKEYEFLAEKGNDVKRFVLLFKKPSITAFSEQNQLVVYPNPASETVSYSLKTAIQESYQLQLIDALGRIVWEIQQEKEGAFLEGMIDMNNYSNGIYLLQISNNEKTISKRIVKE
ncbi:T9SS type A sorting domain-containing protein [Bernardetia sp. Wsw4-3y2]|uniref:T9SS type A sorting domain-containing protein n=1 Tax=Bernardetia sp. Wsw4-3y2 TaxID=3127471 RepID=UPI0030D0784A